MKAVVYEQFGELPQLVDAPDPVAHDGSVVIEVKANGVCRSDWHGWMGHDPTIQLPHVPGHELAGVVVDVGKGVTRVAPGDRVTVPFSCGCGECRYCQDGQLQICSHDFQPGFTHWGSFATLVEIRYAETNLVPLPESLDFVAAASLGCRFATAYRAIIQQARLQPEQWLAVHGCGGLGMSALAIAKAIGARVLAIDIEAETLELARSLGADHTINALDTPKVPKAIKQLTDGGADASIDALGIVETCNNSIGCLRKQGRHIQAGLLLADHATPPIPMGRVIAHELEIYGSHGMSAVDYPAMFELIAQGGIDLERMIGKRIPLSEAARALADMDKFQHRGLTVIDDFDS